MTMTHKVSMTDPHSDSLEYGRRSLGRMRPHIASAEDGDAAGLRQLHVRPPLRCWSSAGARGLPETTTIEGVHPHRTFMEYPILVVRWPHHLQA